MKPKSSICMIVKNEGMNLRRCLDSFLPIIHQEWCELIIVDTGSHDDTVAIALQYTENVYNFEWTGSFADARNYSISRANGEKILIVDADEALKQESIYNLEYLLLKRNESTIFVKIRNFSNKTHDQWSDMLHPRIFKNDGTFFYRGKVHNKPNGKTPYYFASNVLFYHYGYIFEDPVLRQRKCERALPVLLETYKNDRGDLHALTHILKTYYVMEDWDNVIRYGVQWMKDMQNIKYHEGWYAYLEGFIDIVGAYIQKGDIRGAEHAKNECCRYSNRVMSIYMMLGNYYAGRDSEKAAEYFEKVVKIAETESSPYEALLATNAKVLLPEIYNWLSIYHFERCNYVKSGDYLNSGIIRNRNNRIRLRWDIWNDDLSRNNLISRYPNGSLTWTKRLRNKLRNGLKVFSQSGEIKIGI